MRNPSAASRCASGRAGVGRTGTHGATATAAHPLCGGGGCVRYCVVWRGAAGARLAPWRSLVGHHRGRLRRSRAFRRGGHAGRDRPRARKDRTVLRDPGCRPYCAEPGERLPAVGQQRRRPRRIVGTAGHTDRAAPAGTALRNRRRTTTTTTTARKHPAAGANGSHCSPSPRAPSHRRPHRHRSSQQYAGADEEAGTRPDHHIRPDAVAHHDRADFAHPVAGTTAHGHDRRYSVRAPTARWHHSAGRGPAEPLRAFRSRSGRSRSPRRRSPGSSPR